MNANDYLVTKIKAFEMPSISGTGLSSMGFVCDLLFAKDEDPATEDSKSDKPKRRVAVEERKRIFTSTFPGDILHGLIIESLKAVKDIEKLQSPTEAIALFNEKYYNDIVYSCYVSGSFYTCQKVDKQFWFKDSNGEQINTWARSMFFHEKEFDGVESFDPDEIINVRLDREIERIIEKGLETMGYVVNDLNGNTDGGAPADVLKNDTF